MENREEWLARTFVELADTLVADFDVVELLSMLVERCAELLEFAEVGLTFADVGGHLRVMASSSERMRLLELLEVQNSEGPCRDCYDTGQPVLNRRLEGQEASWPVFTPRAMEAGFLMVHALPLRLRDEVIGALNIFSSEPRELSPVDASLAQALADAATITVLQERASKHATALTDQLQVALNARIVIEQAKGILAERLNIPVDEAFHLLRRYARNNRVPLSGVAGLVITGDLGVSELVSERSGRLHRKGSGRGG
jgi:GAF domain-containing protein